MIHGANGHGRTLISLRSQFSRLTDYTEAAVEYNFRRRTRPNSIWSGPREKQWVPTVYVQPRIHLRTHR